MGTSTSSSGAQSGISFDPPWLDTLISDIELPLDDIESDIYMVKPDQQQQDIDDSSLTDLSSEDPMTIENEVGFDISNSIAIDPLIGIAPKARFGGARKNLGIYINTSDRSSLKKSLGQYSYRGMGGARNVAKRLQGSAAIGQKLYSLLRGTQTNPSLREWVNTLSTAKYTSDDIVNEIIKKLIPIGGSVDEESYKDSINYAMIELIDTTPNIDLLNLDHDCVWTILELFISKEAFNRIDLDIGQRFESDKSTPLNNVLRMNDMQEYLEAEISAQIQSLRSGKVDLQSDEISKILQKAITNTFLVFEEEI